MLHYLPSKKKGNVRACRSVSPTGKLWTRDRNREPSIIIIHHMLYVAQVAARLPGVVVRVIAFPLDEVEPFVAALVGAVVPLAVEDGFNVVHGSATGVADGWRSMGSGEELRRTWDVGSELTDMEDVMDAHVSRQRQNIVHGGTDFDDLVRSKAAGLELACRSRQLEVFGGQPDLIT